MQLRKGVEHVRGHGNDSGLAVLGLAQRKLPASHVHVRPFQLEQFPFRGPGFSSEQAPRCQSSIGLDGCARDSSSIVICM